MWVRMAKLSRIGKRKACSLYVIWRSMRERCLCKTYRDYPYYGGRGITICDEWSDYAVFRAWAIANGFGKGMTLDRIDPNGNYEPDNCRWITKGEQQANTRRARMLTIDGKTKSIYEWSRISGVPANVINSRERSLGWPHKQAVFHPPGVPR